RTERILWQGQYDSVADRGLEVDQLALHPVRLVVVARVGVLVEVEFLHIGRQCLGDGGPAAYALAFEPDGGRARHEDAVHHRLQTQLERDRVPLGYAEHVDAEIGGSGRIAHDLLLGAGTATELVGVEYQRCSWVQGRQKLTSG